MCSSDLLQSLMAAGMGRASALVITFPHGPSAQKILHLANEHAPQLPVAVRTVDDAQLDALQQAGATVVVPEALEGSLMLASQTLALVGVPIRRVFRLVQEQRAARYGLMRGYFHGADDDSVDELELQRLQSVTLPPDAVCVGQTLDASLDQRDVGVSVVSVRRAHGQVVTASPSLVLDSGDTLVLSGRPQALLRAESLLLKG